MEQKRIKTRIIHKHAVQADWEKAINFIPLEAELIIYDVDENHSAPRFKIGDGVRTVNELPFSEIKLENLSDGAGEKSLQQVLDTNSWNTSNEWVKAIVKENIPNENGVAINGTFDGTNTTINVGAYGKLSTMMNGKSQTVGGKSHAEGSKTIAFENNAHAEGNETLAAGKHSHAEGNTTSAIGNASHAEGTNTTALGAQSHSEGYNTTAEGDFAHSEGAETKAMDFYTHAEGYNTTAQGVSAHAEGYQTVADGACIHSEGQFNEASGIASHIEGSGNKILSATYSHAEGYQNTTEGDVSHIEGWNNQILEGGNYSHIEGAKNELKGAFSHVEGYNSQVTGDHSHTEGGEHQVFAKYSHVEGHNNASHGYGAHVEGAFNMAEGSYNHINGFRNISDGDYQTVIGKANKIDPTKAFIIGNGEIKNDFTVDNNKRSNAVEVDWDGNAIFAGEVKSGNNTLITEKTLKEGFYNREETDTLLNAQSIELKKSINLTGDKLPNKTSTYIYVEDITNDNKVEFGNKFEYKGKQWFGYVGIKKAALTQGTSYMMIAEVDVETELNLDILTVSGFYCPTGGSDTAIGNSIGKLKKGKNYIMYPFIAGTYERYGFYMDSQVSGSDNAINFTLQDVRLYERQTVKSINISGLKDWKTNILTNDNLIASEISDYVLVYNGYNLIINSLSNDITAEVLLYKPFPEVDKYYRPTTTPFSSNPQSGIAVMGAVNELKQLVDKKTIEYHYYSGTNNKIKLKKGVLYLIMSDSEDIAVFNENDVRVNDTENKQLPVSKTAVILTTSNDLDVNQHIYMNYFLNIEKGTSILGAIPTFTTKNFQLTRVKEALDPNTESLPYCTIGSAANVYELYLG